MRMVRVRTPDNHVPQRRRPGDEIPAEYVAGDVGIAAGDESRRVPHPPRGHMEDAACVAHPAPAAFRAPGREEVARLATRRVAIVEQAVRGDGGTGRDERKRPEEGGAGPGLRLPVVPVPVGRRNEDDIQPVRPVRPAEFSGDLGLSVVVTPAEEDEDAHPLAFRKARRVPGNTVPEADDRAVPPPRCNVHEVHEGIRAHTRKRPCRHQPRTDSHRNRHHAVPPQ